jgi:phage shock protein PspC (stress-responsive transcriptional regulator)
MNNQNSQNRDHLDRFFGAVRRVGITRPRRGRVIAGVASGVARRLGVDPLVVRVGFVLFGLIFGAGLALYLTLWLLLPAEDGTLRIQRALKDGDGSSMALLVVTAISVFGGNAPWWPGDFGGFRFIAMVGLVAAGVWYLTSRRPTATDVPGRDGQGPGAAGPSPVAPESPFRVEPTTPVPDDAAPDDRTGP